MAFDAKAMAVQSLANVFHISHAEVGDLIDAGVIVPKPIKEDFKYGWTEYSFTVKTSELPPHAKKPIGNADLVGISVKTAGENSAYVGLHVQELDKDKPPMAPDLKSWFAGGVIKQLPPMPPSIPPQVAEPPKALAEAYCKKCVDPAATALPEVVSVVLPTAIVVECTHPDCTHPGKAQSTHERREYPVTFVGKQLALQMVDHHQQVTGHTHARAYKRQYLATGIGLTEEQELLLKKLYTPAKPACPTTNFCGPYANTEGYAYEPPTQEFVVGHAEPPTQDYYYSNVLLNECKHGNHEDACTACKMAKMVESPNVVITPKPKPVSIPSSDPFEACHHGCVHDTCTKCKEESQKAKEVGSRMWATWSIPTHAAGTAMPPISMWHTAWAAISRYPRRVRLPSWPQRRQRRIKRRARR